jgi:epsilon-lactone hydrolase
MNDKAKPARYEIHVLGLPGDSLLDAFPELRARHRAHETVLEGDVPDQAALHGVIGRIEALGLELLEVRRVRPRAARSSSAATIRRSSQ